MWPFPQEIAMTRTWLENWFEKGSSNIEGSIQKNEITESHYRENQSHTTSVNSMKKVNWQKKVQCFFYLRR